MSKATLTFTLPEENSEYRLANKAGDLSLIIWDFTNLLREKTKYSDDSGSWEQTRIEWWKLLAEYKYDPHEEL
jgi:hypothetical protein